jgi:non-ribosomal peptide synthetase-like protein
LAEPAPVAGSVLRGPSRPDLLRRESLADILSATARRRPNHPALIWGPRQVTYRELDTASERLAAALAEGGAAPGRILGLFLPRGADLLIAQAGIAKSGAAWLPFDADTPLERVKVCLDSAQAAGLVTSRAWRPRLGHLSVPVWTVEDLAERESPALPRAAAKPSDPAYVIYTSGSTGQPKGIVISHRGICHFLRAENEMLGVCEDDLVYQGFSAAFDMSFEEIWISYLVGATLWIAPEQVVRDPDLLAQSLDRQGVTVLHAVPTLLGLVSDPLPSVRLINLGGEPCPNALAQRFLRPGRRVFNTYGPTETTVSASLSELRPGEPVTIGRPLPNYGLLVVDQQRRPLPVGETGELCVFGAGLALGFLGRPDLTAERFVPNPIAEGPGEATMYLTGDLARLDPGGPAHFLGRADDQVKIRGFRVELEEITAVLKSRPGVAAGTALVRPLGETEEIVAFVVPVAGGGVDTSQLRQALTSRLPPYMVPAHFEVVSQLPRLASGKIDGHALRTAPLDLLEPSTETPAPRPQDEAALWVALEKLFPGRAFWSEADFFDDLGGHSLLAARLVSILRSQPEYAGLSVGEIYQERNLGKIARALERQRRGRRPGSPPPPAEAPLLRRWLCGMAQAAAVPLFVLLHMADWLAPFFVYHYFTGDPGDSVARAVLCSLGTFVLAQWGNFAAAVAGKRALTGRLKAGRYPLWGLVYYRWWLATRFCELPDAHQLAGTPWLPLYLRALGARIGRDVIIDSLTLGAPELLTVEDGVSIGTFVNIENARVEAGELVLGPVRLQRESVVDSFSVLEEGTTLGEGARLCGQSALAAGREIPAGEIWEGAPAAPQNPDLNPILNRNLNRNPDPSPAPLPPRPRVSPVRHWLMAVFSAATALLVSVLFFLPIFPAFMMIDWMDVHTWDIFDSERSPLTAFAMFFLLAIPASALLGGLTMLVTSALRRLLPRQVAGISSVHGLAFWRKRLMTLILENSLHVLHGLYASVFAPVWLRLLGAQVGRHAEISTAEGIVPELLSLGDDCFIADGAMLGDEEVRGGWMILKATRLGPRSFVGNGAYIPDGAVVPEDVLIGVQTRAPRNDQLKPGQTWMGSPPLLLPARERVGGFAESLTFRPSAWRRWARGGVESLRIVLPLAFVIAAGYLIVVLVMPLADEEAWVAKIVGALVVAALLFGLGSFLLVVALKWMLVGRYRPRAAPMWTPFVWISEAVTNLYESLAVPNFLNVLRGTPMLPWALRFLGARIGKGVYLNTTDLTEFDCVRIGDGAELNAWCGPQTHLFEDRVMKIGWVDIGARVTVGARGTILYDTHVGDNARLGPLTLVAKGERLPGGTRWEGSPARPVRDP